MAARNLLLASPPYAVETALKKLGTNLRTARVRRNLSLEQVAEKVGVTRQVVADAERGKPSTGIAIYAALLWTMGLIDQLAAVADPGLDQEGLSLAMAREKTRAGTKKALDNEF